MPGGILARPQNGEAGGPRRSVRSLAQDLNADWRRWNGAERLIAMSILVLWAALLTRLLTRLLGLDGS
jgi:hypothetical protein